MSRRVFFVVLVLSVALSACLPGLSPISAGDSQATSVALAHTQAALTLASLPTPTIQPSNTPLPTFTNTPAPSATQGPTQTATTAPETTGTASVAATSTLAGAGTGTISSNSATVTATVTGTLTATFTPTPGPLLWGTVPPEVPFGFVKLVNLSNDMAYISFHCKLANGLTSYLEYPVYGTHRVKIPAGPCHYVAWVKGQQFIGDVRIKNFEEYTFTFKPKKVLFTQP
jgi:hypothetical protein